MTITINRDNLITTTQVRKREIRDTVMEYRERMKEGDEFPPIDVMQDKDNPDKYWVVDGYHRLSAICHGDCRELPCNVVGTGDEYDALWYSAGANRKNGLRMSWEDVREAIVKLLDSFPDKKPKEIADQIGCGKSVVYEVKKKVEERDKIADNTGAMERLRKYLDDNNDAQNYSNRRIAREAGVSEKTVRIFKDKGAEFSTHGNSALADHADEFSEGEKEHLQNMTLHFKAITPEAKKEEEKLSPKAWNCVQCGEETENPFVVVSQSERAGKIGTRLHFCSAACAKDFGDAHECFVGQDQQYRYLNCFYDDVDFDEGEGGKEAEELPKSDEEFYDPQSRPSLLKVTKDSAKPKQEYQKPTMRTIKCIPLEEPDNIKKVAEDVKKWLGDRADAFRVMFCELMDSNEKPIPF